MVESLTKAVQKLTITVQLLDQHVKEGVESRIRILEQRVSRIEGHINKGVWIILGTFLAGLLSFWRSGGG